MYYDHPGAFPRIFFDSGKHCPMIAKKGIRARGPPGLLCNSSNAQKIGEKTLRIMFSLGNSSVGLITGVK